MTTLVDFNPTVLQPFQFQATLDGQDYTFVVTWNLYGQRYYLACITLGGDLVFNRAMVGSPNDYDINLAGGNFKTSVLVYREAATRFEIAP